MKDDDKLTNLINLVETDKDLIMTMEDAPFFDNDDEVRLENRDTSRMKQLLQQKVSKDYLTYSESDSKGLSITLNELNKDKIETQEIDKGKKYEFKNPTKAFKTDYIVEGSVIRNKSSKIKSKIICGSAAFQDQDTEKLVSTSLDLNEDSEMETFMELEKNILIRKKIKEESEKIALENKVVFNKEDTVKDKLAFLNTIPTAKDNLLVQKLTNSNPEIKISNAGIASILSHLPGHSLVSQSLSNPTQNTSSNVEKQHISTLITKNEKSKTEKHEEIIGNIIQDKQIKHDCNTNENAKIEPEKSDEPFVGKGISNFLHIITKRGYLNNYEFVGKAKNNPFKKHLKDDSGVVIEHRDHLGRVMTEKEAHKYLSIQFQGKNKGKRKLEKTLLKDQIFETNKSKDVNNSTFTLSILRSMQARNKTPELCLNSNRPVN